MASFTRVNGKWKVYVARKGIRKSATFRTKTEAQEWAARTESKILSGLSVSIPNLYFSDLLKRYAETVSAHKKSGHWEQIYINAVNRMPISKVKLADIDERHVAQWRDERLQCVKPSSVRREMALLRSACNVAVQEWKWLGSNPFSKVKRPSSSQPRDRRITDEEIAQILHVCNFEEGMVADTVAKKTAVAFLFAIETAMRLGEICSLEWGNVNLDERTAFLPETKNGTSRTVPLSSRSVELLKMLPRTSGLCFDIGSPYLSRAFTRCKRMTTIKNLHFHDTRHEAITRLSKKLGVLELARMVGHRDLKSLMIYYNPTASELARKLD